VADLGVGITGQNFNEVSHNIGDANIPVMAPLAGETMESALADGRDRIAQSPAEGLRRCVAGVMIQKEKAEAPRRRIRMAERGGLHRGDRNLLAQTRPAFLPEREPSVDNSRLRGQFASLHPIGLMVSRSSIASRAPRSCRRLHFPENRDNNREMQKIAGHFGACTVTASRLNWGIDGGNLVPPAGGYSIAWSSSGAMKPASQLHQKNAKLKPVQTLKPI
jgi:hypothetical protein